MSPTAGWTATAICRAQRNSRRRFSCGFHPTVMPRESGASSNPRRCDKLGRRGLLDHPPSRMMTSSFRAPIDASITPEHEFAVAFKERSGPHIELSVLADEKQRALRYLFRALQQQLGIVGAHLVGKRLA